MRRTLHNGNGDEGFVVSHPSVVTLKFIEEQLQILRLTTPKLHPTNQDPFVGTPAEKRLGPVRSG